MENAFGKGENAVNQHFLLFPQCFFKGLLRKPRVIGKGLKTKFVISLTLRLYYAVPTLSKKAFENTVGNDEIIVNQHFLLFSFAL